MARQSLRYLPVGWFSLAMGACGLALALRSARVAIGVPEAPGELVALGALVLEAALVAAYLLRYLKHRDAVVAEFTNPVTLGFTATFPVSLMLAAGCLAPWAEHAAMAVWWLGAGMFAIYQVFALSRWLRGGFELGQVNGGWLIIVLGGFVAPLGGLPLGILTASQVLFGISFVLSPFMVALVLWRAIAGPPLANALRPSLFILLVPPSLTYLLYPAIGGESPFWTKACFYLSVALAFALFAYANQCLSWPFGPAWGAFTFPLDALANAALRNAALTNSSTATLFAWLALGIAAATVALVLGRALGALARGTLCAVPPPPAATGGGSA